MSLFPFFKKKEFFSPEDHARIAEAIRNAEQKTSGEIRVFVENRCRFINPLHRAAEVFYGLKMEHTRHRNGVLLYIAMKDRQLAIYGDEGIHNKLGNTYWNNEVKKILSHFNNNNYVQGITDVVTDIGNSLRQFFPYEDGDRNELPDDIIIGK
ncbi:MAG TPA: TPM domain-containing protein [Chitinophagaceae bacterium]|nr:TPM domain-containing protein [Chitinophagaceae bacterium]